MKRIHFNSIVAGALLPCVMGLTTILPAIGQTYNGQTLQGRVTYVPVGTNLDATLTSSIDSSVAKPGDLFTAKLYSPLYLGSDLVLPGNTTLEGQLVSAEKSGLGGKNGAMSMRLTSAVTPDGIRYPLSAMVTTQQPNAKIDQDKQGNLKGQSTKKTIATGVARTAAWTAGGTLLGICFAPIVAGTVGAGAIAGVATGGAVGLGSNLWRKGKDVKIPSNTRIQFALDQPMSLSSNVAATGSMH
ncbi:MAG: hypothetical protein C0508_29370 [Cyanobacteria bacterium PR.023]|jgi:hypothetical protein|nr:hypothetical protein [Cyanobacteria bacterium PR.023]MDQ5932976.1 hypothetical protein [Cyanobacteriota bacterium erpe_2018_sw_21hr_WHONDRS-SW48-000092_B_bin.40]